MEAFHGGDVDALVEMYTQDAVIHGPLSAPLRGHRDIERHFDGVIESGLIDEVEIHSDHIDVIGDTAYEEGRYVTYSQPGVRFSNGSYITIWKNEGGTWKVYREMISVEHQAPIGRQHTRRSDGQRR